VEVGNAGVRGEGLDTELICSNAVKGTKGDFAVTSK